MNSKDLQMPQEINKETITGETKSLERFDLMMNKLKGGTPYIQFV
jgi:hypothetical protein